MEIARFVKIFEEVNLMKTGIAWYLQEWNIHPNSFEKLITKKRSVQLIVERMKETIDCISSKVISPRTWSNNEKQFHREYLQFDQRGTNKRSEEDNDGSLSNKNSLRDEWFSIVLMHDNDDEFEHE